MENKRETVTVEAAGHKAEIYAYLTVREAAEVEASYYDGARYVTGAGGTTNFENFNLVRAEFQVKQKTLEKILVSFDGENSGQVDKILSLPKEEFAALFTAITDVLNKKKA